MNCKDVRNFLILTYLDEKTEEVNQEITSHLMICKECDNLNKKIQSIERYPEKFRKITPSDRTWNNIKKELVKEKRHFKVNFLRLPLLKFAIPAAIFIIILAIFVFNRSGVKSDDPIAEFVGNQAEFIVSLEFGDTTLYEPLSEEER